jgi:hypothetical protein
MKVKEGNGKLVANALWEPPPPLCPETRKKARDHLKPTWASARGWANRVENLANNISVKKPKGYTIRIQEKKTHVTKNTYK